MLKDTRVSPPVLSFPDSIAAMTLTTDTCDLRVGCVFLQIQKIDITDFLGIGPNHALIQKRDTKPHKRNSGT